MSWHIDDSGDSRRDIPPCNWEDVLQQLGDWADDVSYVATTPDFWEELESSRETITAVDASPLPVPDAFRPYARISRATAEPVPGCLMPLVGSRPVPPETARRRASAARWPR